MKKFNRRAFLQLLGAAGLTPLLPTMRARATVASGGASVSKALWASLYANSGSASGFVSFSKSIGLSNTAIQGISARSVGVRLALTTASESLTRTTANTVRPSLSPKGEMMEARHKITRTFERYFRDATEIKPITTQDHASKPAGECNAIESNIEGNPIIEPKDETQLSPNAHGEWQASKLSNK